MSDGSRPMLGEEAESTAPGRLVRLANSTAGIVIFSLSAIAALAIPFGRWRPRRVVRLVGSALLAGAWVFGMVALRRLGGDYSRRVIIKEEQRLVTDGPYARMRHPLYSATLLMYLGACLATGSGVGLVVLAVFVVPRFALVARYEDRLLEETFGEEHRTWQRRSGRFWPRS